MSWQAVELITDCCVLIFQNHLMHASPWSRTRTRLCLPKNKKKKRAFDKRCVGSRCFYSSFLGGRGREASFFESAAQSRSKMTFHTYRKGKKRCNILRCMPHPLYCSDFQRSTRRGHRCQEGQPTTDPSHLELCFLDASLAFWSRAIVRFVLCTLDDRGRSSRTKQLNCFRPTPAKQPLQSLPRHQSWSCVS